MKKRAANFWILIITLAAFISLCSVAGAAPQKSVAELMEERSAVCWVEGEPFGDNMIIGARGKIEFIYLDAKMTEAIAKDRTLPSWLDNANQYTAGASKKAVFIAVVQANKPWDFDMPSVFVGKHHLSKEDLLSTGWYEKLFIESGATGRFVFEVPKDEVKKGAEITLGYGDYSVKWRAPK